MFGNMGGMMQKMKKMQDEMKKMQDDLKTKAVSVTVGGGVVTIEMSGEKKVTKVNIDPSVINAEDKEMLEDLIIAGINEATEKVDEMVAAEMSKITGGMKLPPGMF